MVFFQNRWCQMCPIFDKHVPIHYIDISVVHPESNKRLIHTLPLCCLFLSGARRLVIGRAGKRLISLRPLIIQMWMSLRWLVLKRHHPYVSNPTEWPNLPSNSSVNMFKRYGSQDTDWTPLI